MAVTDGIFSSKAELNSSLQASQFGTNIKPLSTSEKNWLAFVGKDRYGNDTGWGKFLTMFNSLSPGSGAYFDNARGTVYDTINSNQNDDVTKAHELADTEGYRIAHNAKQWSKKMEGGKAFYETWTMAAGISGATGGGGSAPIGEGEMTDALGAEGNGLSTFGSNGMGVGESMQTIGNTPSADTFITHDDAFALDPSKSTAGTLGGQLSGMMDYKPTEEETVAANEKQSTMDKIKQYKNEFGGGESFTNIFKVGGGIANVNTSGNTSAAAEEYNKTMANLASHEGDLDVMESIPIVNIYAGFSKSVYDINASRDAQEAKVKYYLQSLPRSMNLDESQFIG